MIELKQNISVRIHKWMELPPDYRTLLEEAGATRLNAQAPYSNYKVGAALQSVRTGRIYTGCNVERASYTQTTHAEQNAIDNLVAQSHGRSEPKILAIAIVGAPAQQEWPVADLLTAKQRGMHTFENIGCPSCGHCLQIIWENCFGNPDVPLIWPVNGGVAVMTIADAFPLRFGPSDLGINYSKK